jgi:hypothetical protein
MYFDNKMVGMRGIPTKTSNLLIVQVFLVNFFQNVSHLCNTLAYFLSMAIALPSPNQKGCPFHFAIACHCSLKQLPQNQQCHR